MLRVHQLGVTAGVLEKPGVKAIYLVKHRCGSDVVGVVEPFCCHPCLSQLLSGQGANRLDPLLQVAAERVDRVCAGKTTGHPDDGNGARMGLHRTLAVWSNIHLGCFRHGVLLLGRSATRWPTLFAAKSGRLRGNDLKGSLADHSFLGQSIR